MSVTCPSKVDEYLSKWKDFEKNVINDLCKCIQSLNNLPQGSDDFEDYCALFPQFKELIGIEEKRITKLITKLLRHSMIRLNIFSKDSLTDLHDSMEKIIDINDIILERVNNSFDEECGLKKPETLLVVDNTSLSEKKYSLLTAKNVTRPQMSFRDVIDNSRGAQFLPKINFKYNALIPDNNDSNLQSNLDKHPYHYEISYFKVPAKQLKNSEPQESTLFDERQIILVDNVEQLNQLVDNLSNVSEFAVDLEHHSYRSYSGFTCLIQISTRKSHYVIDALALRHELYVLNKVFTDSNILKVFHGSDSDIVWLQKDFSVYVVNMFDTGQAARVLRYPRFSLAYLLTKFVNVSPNKNFQLADWRVRPLPNDMLKYASQDTHYLLYIYDSLRNELINKGNDNLLYTVYQRSTQLCLKVYHKKVFFLCDSFQLLNRSLALNSRQKYILTLLYDWRDQVARLEDESPAYVMSTNMLLELCLTMPNEREGIAACCNPLPPLVRIHIDEIFSLFLKAASMSEEAISDIVFEVYSEVKGSNGLLISVPKVVVPLTSMHDFNGTDNNWAKEEYSVESRNVEGFFVERNYIKNVNKKVSKTFNSRIDTQLMKSIDTTELNRIRLYQYYSHRKSKDLMATHCLLQSFAKWKFVADTVKSDEKIVIEEQNVCEEYSSTNIAPEVSAQSFFPFSGKREKKLKVNMIEAKRFRPKKIKKTENFNPFNYANKIKEVSATQVKVKKDGKSNLGSKTKAIFKKIRSKKRFMTGKSSTFE